MEEKQTAYGSAQSAQSAMFILKVADYLARLGVSEGDVSKFFRESLKMAYDETQVESLMRSVLRVYNAAKESS